MSKVKSPQEKKRLSYQHDRRNVYGENQKSSRKNIPLSKQLQHQAERRAGQQAIAVIDMHADADEIDHAIDQMEDRTREQKLQGFRKSPDQPLGKVLVRKTRLRAAG